MKKIILACLLAVSSTSVNAFNGADLLGQCSNFVDILEGRKTDLQKSLLAGQCGGYVLGVQQGFIASSELAAIASEDKGLEPVTGKYWNIPENVEPEKIVKIVVRYLEINKDMQSKPAVLSIINALIQTYPVKG